jgi:hypothetical protein
MTGASGCQNEPSQNAVETSAIKLQKGAWKKAKAFQPVETVVAEIAALCGRPFDADGQKFEGEIYYEDIHSRLNHEYGRGYPLEAPRCAMPGAA